MVTSTSTLNMANVPTPGLLTLDQPWLVLLALIVLVGLGIGLMLGRERKATEERLVSNSEYLEELPEFKRWLRRYKSTLAALVVAVLAAGTAGALAAARPVTYEVYSDRQGTRDIVLCLDMSGSMIGFNERIIDNMLDLVDGFHGERIAFAIFNSTTRVVFPLTDDYAMVREQLLEAREATTAALSLEDVYEWNATEEDWANLDKWLAFVAGTIDIEDASSLVPDGLATCALQFDDAATDRSRSVILATDNEVIGEGIYTLEQAAQLTQERNADLFSLFTADPRWAVPSAEMEMREVTRRVGGMFLEAENPASIDAILEQVRNQQMMELEASPDLVTHDHIVWPVGLAAVGLVVLIVVSWRAER